MTARFRHTIPIVGLLILSSLSGPFLVSEATAQAIEARPWLGVAMDRDSPGQGARVGRVIRNSPADRAGLRDGDRLTRVARTDIVRGADVVRAVAQRTVGDLIEIAFVRAGKELSARVTLAAFPPPDEMMRMDLVGAFAPDWKNVDAVNGPFPASIGALRGHVVVLDFWATWCAPCRVVAPELGALQSRYGAQGLTVLGISTEDPGEVGLFARQTLMRYAVGVDKHAETTLSYGVASLPTVVVIDKRGVVREVSVGYELSEKTRLEGIVQALLAERALPE